MSDKPFIVASEKGLKALPYWLRKIDYNTWSWSDQRRINIGWDSKPDSDWSKSYPRGSIVITKPELFEPVLEILNQEPKP
jgi:hypothetical protein